MCNLDLLKPTRNQFYNKVRSIQLECNAHINDMEDSILESNYKKKSNK